MGVSLVVFEFILIERAKKTLELGMPCLFLLAVFIFFRTEADLISGLKLMFCYQSLLRSELTGSKSEFLFEYSVEI
jgi:hypothetical protein